MDLLDSIVVDDNLQLKRAFFNDCFGSRASLEDLTCDIDMNEDPEWTNKFMDDYLSDIPPTASIRVCILIYIIKLSHKTMLGG